MLVPILSEKFYVHNYTDENDEQHELTTFNK